MTETGQPSDTMTCRELADFLDDYLAGDLTADVRSRFETHLVACRDCLVYVRGYRDTVRVLREIGREDAATPPDDVPPELLRAIRNARTRKS